MDNQNQPPLYHNRAETWNLDCAKAPGFADRKSTNISNIDRLTIGQPRELLHSPNPKFLPDCGIITTIIPTYRRAERLKKAVQSVLNQTFPHVTICIYDNASDDETSQAVADLMAQDSRIRYYRHSVNIGAVENMQYAMDRVSTPFFSFLADDDYLLPQCYETTLKGFEKYPDIACSLGAVFEVEDQGQVVQMPLRAWPDRDYFAAPDGLIEMIGKYSNWTGALLRTDLVKAIGSLDVSIKAVDVDFLFRVAARFPIAICKKACAVFVQHASSYSSSHGLKVYWPSWLTMIQKLQQTEQIPLQMRQQAEELLKRDLANALFMTTVRLIEQRQYSQADKALELFKQQGGKGKKEQVLRCVLGVCQKLPLLQLAFSKLLELRRFWNRRVRHTALQHEFQRMIRWANP